VVVLAIHGVEVEKPCASAYVSSDILFNPYVITNMGRRPAPRTEWTVDGANEAELELLQNHSLVFRPTKQGRYNVVGKIERQGKPYQGVAQVEVDYLLEIAGPKKVQIPLGSSYTIQVTQPLESYTLQAIPSTLIDHHTFIGSQVGFYAIVVLYHDQWDVLAIQVSDPYLMYLSSEAVNQIRPVPLDRTCHPYNLNVQGVDYECDFCAEIASIENGSKVFKLRDTLEVRVPVNITVSSRLFRKTAITYVFSNSLINPDNAYVQQGQVIDFSCSVKVPHWKSAVPRVATVSQGGEVNTLKTGKTYIHCTDEILTSLNVVNIKDITAKKVEKDTYLIIPILNDVKVNQWKVKYNQDLKYGCEFSGKKCASASEGQFNSTHHFCRIVYFNKKACPYAPHLTVYASSKSANLYPSISNQIIVLQERVVNWIVDAENWITLPSSQSWVVVEMDVQPSEISIIADNGLNLHHLGKNRYNLTADMNQLIDKGFIQVTHKREDESVWFYVSSGRQLRAPREFSSASHLNPLMRAIGHNPWLAFLICVTLGALGVAFHHYVLGTLFPVLRRYP
jgi:hypothetical protein